MSRYRTPDNTPLTAAQAKLVKAHVRWADQGARKHAHRWRRYVTEDDLRSAAHLGLIMAARKFDPSRGLAFKTLAFTYCDSLMRREVDQVRRLNGAVFDYRVEGHMRATATRIPWPTFEDGTPQDLVGIPPAQHDALARQQQLALIEASCQTDDERALLAAVRATDTSRAAAARLGIAHRTVMVRLQRLTARLQARLGLTRAA